MNSNEWHLDTSIAAGGRSKILQFVVYILLLPSPFIHFLLLVCRSSCYIMVDSFKTNCISACDMLLVFLEYWPSIHLVFSFILLSPLFLHLKRQYIFISLVMVGGFKYM